MKIKDKLRIFKSIAMLWKVVEIVHTAHFTASGLRISATLNSGVNIPCLKGYL